MTDTAILATAVASNPTDVTARLVYADALQESGDDTRAAAERTRAETIRTVGPVAYAQSLITGRTRAAGKLRGALCRLTGATDRRGRPLTCVVFRVVAGGGAPGYVGESYHFETPSGKIIHHPNAYRRVAKSARIVYCPASHVVTVGADWLLAYADSAV